MTDDGAGLLVAVDADSEDDRLKPGEQRAQSKRHRIKRLGLGLDEFESQAGVSNCSRAASSVADEGKFRAVEGGRVGLRSGLGV